MKLLCGDCLKLLLAVVNKESCCSEAVLWCIWKYPIKTQLKLFVLLQLLLYLIHGEYFNFSSALSLFKSLALKRVFGDKCFAV